MSELYKVAEDQTILAAVWAWVISRLRHSASKFQPVAIGEQRRSAAGVDEDHIVRRLPSSEPDQRDQAGQSFARIDRVQCQGLQPSGQLDCLEGCGMWDAVGR